MVIEDVVEFATIFKIVRIIFIAFITLSYANMNKEEKAPLLKAKSGNHAKVKAKTP